MTTTSAPWSLASLAIAVAGSPVAFTVSALMPRSSRIACALRTSSSAANDALRCRDWALLGLLWPNARMLVTSTFDPNASASVAARSSARLEGSLSS